MAITQYLTPGNLMYFNKINFSILGSVLAAGIIISCQYSKQNTGRVSAGQFKPMINGRDLSGWVNVNDAPATWLVNGDTLEHTGKVQSNLRTTRRYENFILDFYYSGGSEKSQAFIIVHSGALPDLGQSMPGGIKQSLFDNTNNSWNHCQVVSNHSGTRITINNKEVISRKGQQLPGFINFSSIAGEFKVTGLKIQELSSTNELSNLKIEESDGFVSLYNGADLSQWNVLPGHREHWTGLDWYINYDGKSIEKDKCLWTKKSYRDFILIADVRLTRKPEMAKSPVILPNGENELNKDGSKKEVDVYYAGDTGIYLRGNSKSQVNIGYRHLGSGEIYGYRVDTTLSPVVRSAVTPKIKADRPPGEWNRFIITMKGDVVTVLVNGQLVIDHATLPGIPESGPLALQDDHADNNTFQFANLYIKELN